MIIALHRIYENLAGIYIVIAPCHSLHGHSSWDWNTFEWLYLWYFDLGSYGWAHLKDYDQMFERSQILMSLSWPTVNRRFLSSSRSMYTMECLASLNDASEGRSTVCSCLKQGSQQRTSNSKPIIGMLIRFVEQLSHTAFPQWRQWCCRIPLREQNQYRNWFKYLNTIIPSCFWSIMERKFQKKGLNRADSCWTLPNPELPFAWHSFPKRQPRNPLHS